MRKILTLFAATLFAAQAWATDIIEFHGLYYEKITADGTNLRLISADGYKNLTSVNIPSTFTDDATYTVTEIGGYAFSGCDNLTQVTLPGTLTTIMGGAFYYCTALEEIDIPSSVTNIGSSAFCGCENLERVVINSASISIGESAFNGCSALTQVEFTSPNPDIALDAFAFDSCESLNLQYTEENGARYMALAGNPYFQLVEAPDDVTSFVINSNCKSIGGYVFNERTELTSVTIPNGVKVIGSSAFRNCENLTAIDIPNSVISIGLDAFHYCISLERITIPGSVKNVSQNAFASCANLKHVVVEDGVNELDYYSFGWCNLESLTLPSSVIMKQSLGYNSLKQIFLPSSFDNDPYDWAIGQSMEEIVCEAANSEACGLWEQLYLPDEGSCTYVWNSKNKKVTVERNDANGGTVSGGGTYAYGAQATISATAGNGYKFVGWSDGNHENPRTVIVRDNEAAGNSGINTYTATFYSNDAETYEIIAAVKGKGSVSGDGIYLKNASVTLTATPQNADIYHFAGWSNGTAIVSTNKTYTFTATQDVSLTAIFEGTEVSVGDNAAVPAIGRIKDNAVFRPTITGRYTISSTFSEEDNTLAYGYLLDSDENILVEKAGEYSTNGNFSFKYNLEAGATYYIGAGFNDNNQSGNVPLNISQPQLIILTAAEGNGVVEGTGYYNYNGSAVLTPQPATGYHFEKWKDDNSTDNPRTITVTESKTYTAIFAINEYAIAATGYANGTIEGTGTYTHGQTVTLTASAATGYHFNGWGDGNSDNPRTFEATEAKNLTPSFAINTYTVSVGVENGTVTGAGTYNHGQTATLTATANSGYEFSSWSDEVTDNPRQIQVTENISIRAIIISEGEHVYAIRVTTPQNGTITGDGLYIVGRTATLEATPADGYHFVGWGDGNTDNPRTIVVSTDMNLTPSFAINNYTVAVTTVGNGTVSGTGSFDYGQDVTLTASADNGYHFVGWNDGGTDNPRSFTATCDSSLTATFEINSYRVTGIAVNGTISGAHTYTHGSEATLTAYPEYGYHFTEWSDGEKNETRTFAVMRDTSFTALFEANTYTATVANAQHGTVSGAGEYTHGQTATFTATAEAGYNFLFWGDGSTANPRTVKMTQDVEMRAVFALEGHSAFTIAVGANGNGSVQGGGLYIEGDSATVTAKPESEAYHFVAWSDGNIENPRSFVVSNDTSFSATFEPNTFVVKAVSDNSEFGTVSGDGTYAFGATIVLKATPNEGYRFVRWSDDDIYNIKYLTASENYDFIAYFAPVTDTVSVTDTIYLKSAISQNAVKLKIYPNPTTSFVTVAANHNFSYTLTNMSGMVIKKEENSASYVVDLSGYPAGIYLLNTSDGKTHKIMKK